MLPASSLGCHKHICRVQRSRNLFPLALYPTPSHPIPFTDRSNAYGYEPLLLETFVDRSCHDGACFVAANWIAAGRTAGRGRFAPTGTAVPPKTVFLLPLRADWRAELGVPAPRLPALDTAAGLDRDAWAAQEFGGAALGDVRLTQRLVRCAAVCLFR